MIYGIRGGRSPWLMLLLALVAPAGGCSRGGRPEPKRYPVSGTVTLDGQPLQEGKAQFVTVSQGLIDVLPIKDGRFSGQAASGDRRVEFFFIKEVPYAESGYRPMPGETPPATVKIQVLPPHLNSESTFTATVEPTGKNEFTFALSAQPPEAAKRRQP
jgi:hypothetical protein